MQNIDTLFTNLIIVVIFLGMVTFFFYAIYQVIQNEKAKNKFLPTMKVGDEVHFSSQRSFDGVVRDLNPTDDPDLVEVSVILHKNSLYPGKSLKNDEIIS